MSITFSPSGKESEQDVSMSNCNAFAVLALLDIETDYCGNITSEEMIQKIDAIVSVKSHVVEPSIDKEEGHATMIFGGRSENYLLTRLQQLRDLAVKNPGRLCWG